MGDEEHFGIFEAASKTFLFLFFLIYHSTVTEK